MMKNTFLPTELITNKLLKLLTKKENINIKFIKVTISRNKKLFYDIFLILKTIVQNCVYNNPKYLFINFMKIFSKNFFTET